MTPLAGLLALSLALASGPADPAPEAPPAATFAALGDAAALDLLILGAGRPVILRLRVMIGDRPFRAAWAGSVAALHARLDGDGDGRLTTKEAEDGGLATFLTPAGGFPGARGQIEPDVRPKDGVISVEELTEALRSAAGPYRVRVGGPADRRADALFEHLDRDRDGGISRAELAGIAGTLRRLDRDENELIGADEVEPPAAPAAAPAVAMMNRRGPAPGLPAAVELDAGESSLRMARLMLRKYDTDSTRGTGKPDGKLSPEEFAIGAVAFAAADASGDGTLNGEELRRFLSGASPDAILDVALTPDASGRAVARVRGADGGPPAGCKVRQLAEDVVEVDVGLIRLDIHVDDGAGAADAARGALKAQFAAADANQDGYLEPSELTPGNGQPAPLAALFKPLDRDGDGKLYPRELDDYVTQQAAAARGRLTLTGSDEGRALFGLLDLDRDRQLGAREVLDTFARVSACDRDGDGRVTPDEIPHHIRLTLARGDLAGPIAPGAAGPAAAANPQGIAPPRARPTAGPAWFRRMDRNRDGDVSWREFLGSRDQFNRLDRDRDGLIAPDEAAAARPVTAPGD